MRTSEELGPEDAPVVTAACPTVRQLVGRVGDHLAVSGHVLVIGTVAAGATLDAAAVLEVQGSLDGPVRLGHDAQLTVHGSYRGDCVTTEGSVVVTGVASLDAVRHPCVLVSRGSVLLGAYGEAWTIDAGGGLRRLAGETSTDLHTSPMSAEHSRWSEVSGVFVPAHVPPRGA